MNLIKEQANEDGEPIEPDYELIKMDDEQYDEVFSKIANLWPQMVSEVGAEQMSKEEALELLKNVAEDINLEEDVYDTYFLDEQT